MGYLVKPFQKSDLLPAIEVALARYAELRCPEGGVQDLDERLEARKLVDRAKGLLMDRDGMKRGGCLPVPPEDGHGRAAQGGRGGEAGRGRRPRVGSRGPWWGI